MKDRLPVLLAGTIGGIKLYEFDDEYEVYEGDHCTIFDNVEDAMAYYYSVGGYLLNEDQGYLGSPYLIFYKNFDIIYIQKVKERYKKERRYAICFIQNIQMMN